MEKLPIAVALLIFYGATATWFACLYRGKYKRRSECINKMQKQIENLSKQYRNV